MTERVPVADLRDRLASVMDAASSGSVYVVTRRGRDVALIGPAAGNAHELLRAAEDCARNLRETEAARDGALAEVLRLRAQIDDLREELHNAQEALSVADGAARKGRWTR